MHMHTLRDAFCVFAGALAHEYVERGPNYKPFVIVYRLKFVAIPLYTERFCSLAYFDTTLPYGGVEASFPT